MNGYVDESPSAVPDEPLHWFVRDRGSSAAHHLDYEAPLSDHALCGHGFAEIVWEGPDRPRAVCRRCQAAMPSHEAKWWKAMAERQEAEQNSAISTIRLLQSELAAMKDVAARDPSTQTPAVDQEGPLNWFVRDRGSRVAHHLDYRAPLLDHALCGHPFAEILWEGQERPRAVCVRCQQRMPAHEAFVWQRRAEDLGMQLDEVGRGTGAEIERLRQKVANQRAEILRLLSKSRAPTGSSRDVARKPAGRERSTLPSRVQDEHQILLAQHDSARRMQQAAEADRASSLASGGRGKSVRAASAGLPSLGKRR